ncbi:MAG TPA: hypothetical protein VKQ54_07715 [Caulobacteraceae bacterium]|nr:hypothetical protein [Caulobacteraceae bacterium]
MAASLNRRMLIAAGAGLLTPAWADTLALETPAAAAPLRCADFLDSIGVNTHLRYVATQYNDVEAVIAAMKYAGLRYARDTAPDTHKPNASHYEAFARAGLSFCLFWGLLRTMENALGDVGALAAAHPGAVHALEGPNEISARFAYGGLEGVAAAQKFMIDLRAGAARIPSLRRLPQVNFTSFTPAAGDCDFANQHPYPKAGAQPRERIRNAWEKQVGPQGVMPGKPMMFTEFGYHTLVGKPARAGHWQGVDEERQAAMLINGWLDAAATGVGRVYVYQLLDGQSDRPGNPNQENHFGLFRLDGSPKPAATAFRTLISLLADHGPRARAFTPAPIAARVTLERPLSCLALQASTGAAYLALWNESPLWDPQAAAPLAIAPAMARVTLPTARPLTAFDIVDQGRAQELGATASAAIPVGSHPLLLRLA